MELTQLEYFLTVARLQHMTQASKALNLTQPALSHAISKLELELGVPLFERSGRNLELNRYGQMFMIWVEQAMQDLTKGTRELQEWTNPDTGVIALSYLNILGVDLVPTLIRDYQRTHPQVRFELTQGSLGDIDEHLNKGLSDLMITSRESFMELHEWIVIQTLPLFIVVSAQHPFADRPSLSLTELSGEPFVGLKNNCGLKATILARFQSTGFTLTSTYDAEDLITVAGFINAGLGVSVLPRTMGLELDGLVWIPIQEEGWQWELGLKWRKDRYVSPAAKRFIEYVQSLCYDGTSC
ncbi:LysR family transcriptional regulator [Paenibacillus sp. MBLB2552]|uniref:LysR family transcriptional regulator n=1 Tax=Paenibacillus mellifer TaxID=2937794 RepID=A0A9X2BR53_9BACL|nr:LysR family transcriptional regulator [Paenibacillus mellifer]MCK8486935.1 LysR family transcriptional regulator [Paenibacillus mellifer]